MKVVDTEIEGVKIIEPKVFNDSRGFFFESFNDQKFHEALGVINFIQDNESYSRKGVLRGLHFQSSPFSQAKLVRCVQGKVLDVVVDLRNDSPSFKKWISVELSSDNKRQLFVPRGFAHGFVVLSDYAVFAYKVDNMYSKDHEGGIIFNDPDLSIDWVIDESELILSEKDLQLPLLKDIL